MKYKNLIFSSLRWISLFNFSSLSTYQFAWVCWRIWALWFRNPQTGSHWRQKSVHWSALKNNTKLIIVKTWIMVLRQLCPVYCPIITLPCLYPYPYSWPYPIPTLPLILILTLTLKCIWVLSVHGVIVPICLVKGNIFFLHVVQQDNLNQ